MVVESYKYYIDDSCDLNSVYLIHSNFPGELNLGRRLETCVFPKLSDQFPYFKFEAYEADSVSELLDVVGRISRDANEFGVKPIVHLDMHGTDSGLITNDGDFIDWDVLIPLFVSINKNSCFNLLLVMTTCQGFSFIKRIVPTGGSPCWGIIAVDGNILNAETFTMLDFYANFLNGKTSRDIMMLMNEGIKKENQFKFVTSRQLFCHIWRHYVESCTDRVLTERAYNIMRLAGDHAIDLVKLSHLKAELGDFEVYFQKYKRVFFMDDHIPGNSQRFNVQFEDIYRIERINLE